MTARGLLIDERGNATILGAFAIAGIAAVTLLVIYLGAAAVARHRAQSAADLAALAAALAQVGGAAEPCAAASELAAAQEPAVEVADCRLDGDDVLVRTRVPVDLGAFGLQTATAQARAGPAE